MTRKKKNKPVSGAGASKGDVDDLEMEKGVDTAGRRYTSLNELWSSLQIQPPTPIHPPCLPPPPPTLSSASITTPPLNEDDRLAPPEASQTSATSELEQSTEALERALRSLVGTVNQVSQLGTPHLPSAAPSSTRGDHVWYARGAAYWARQEATANGVLGGFASISSIDCAFSRQFLNSLFRGANGTSMEAGRALDCGAGIGRVSRGVLLLEFKEVDLVEQDKGYVERARVELQGMKGLGEVHCCGLQSYDFPRRPYDCIWIQWVLGHLTDRDVISFFLKAKAALSPHGLLCIKENVTSSGGFVFDLSDCSLTRSRHHIVCLARRSGFRLRSEELQVGFPSSLLPVRTFAFEPVQPTPQ